MKTKKLEKFEIGKCYILEKRNFKEILKIESELMGEMYGISIKQWISTMECVVDTIVYQNPSDFKETSYESFASLKAKFIAKLHQQLSIDNHQPTTK